MAEPRRQPGTGALKETDSAVKRPELYRVVLHNDDYTTMEFVVQVLETVFLKHPAEAYRVMMQVHVEGHGVCGVYPLRDRRDEGRHGARPGARARVPAAGQRRRGMTDGRWERLIMFSASIEMLLQIAYREAVSRRHTT